MYICIHCDNNIICVIYIMIDGVCVYVYVFVYVYVECVYNATIFVAGNLFLKTPLI